MLGTEGVRRQEWAGCAKGYQEGNVSCTITYQSDSKTHVLWAGYDLIWVSGQLLKVDLLMYLSQCCESGPWSTKNFLKTFLFFFMSWSISVSKECLIILFPRNDFHFVLSLSHHCLQSSLCREMSLLWLCCSRGDVGCSCWPPGGKHSS